MHGCSASCAWNEFFRPFFGSYSDAVTTFRRISCEDSPSRITCGGRGQPSANGSSAFATTWRSVPASYVAPKTPADPSGRLYGAVVTMEIGGIRTLAGNASGLTAGAA